MVFQGTFKTSRHIVSNVFSLREMGAPVSLGANQFVSEFNSKIRFFMVCHAMFHCFEVN